MLLDHYSASYYRKIDDDVKSLFTVKKFEFQRDFGILLSNDTAVDMKECLIDYFDDIYENWDNDLHPYVDTSEVTYSRFYCNVVHCKY